MNYRHAFHAGNFADVLKHATLARILLHLCTKPAAFRVIDTHAGAGLYDLTGPEASRTGEWRDGIGRLRAAPLAPDVASLLAPYVEAIAAFNEGDALKRYPGSPLLALRLMRAQDRLTACELAPPAAAALKHALARDARATVVTIDGYVALKAYVPPKERRGLVLVDPPFEQPAEFSRLANCIEQAWRKWTTGTFMLWHPLKDRRAATAFAHALGAGPVRKILRAEIEVNASATELGAAGLIVINPPWRLADELNLLLPAFVRLFARGSGGGYRLDWLRPEA
jgi:23S rRNA (adenine2030-N6)-methyltransferase